MNGDVIRTVPCPWCAQPVPVVFTHHLDRDDLSGFVHGETNHDCPRSPAKTQEKAA